ncbi:TPA: peptidase M23, partial [Enterococcus faecium]
QAAPAVTETTATPASTSSAKEWIAQKESSGSYTATNGRYIGRYQLDSSYLNGDYSAANQEKVAEQYVASRYGSWEAAKAFWEANGWY